MRDDEPAIPPVTASAPAVMVEFLLPLVVSYKMVDAVPLVLAANVSAPVWLMMLFEVKVILPPLAFCVMAPVELIPVLPPAPELFPVMVIFPAAFVMVDAPRLTTVAAVADVPVIVTPAAAERAAELVIAITEPVVVAIRLIEPA